MKKEKEPKKGIFSFFNRSKSGCCDMKIVEIKEETAKKECCDFKILPGEKGGSE